MSRTNKGDKGSGYEYWSRRNYKWCTDPGRSNKKITNRVERRKSRQSVMRDND